MKKLTGFSVLCVSFILGCSPTDQNSSVSNTAVPESIEMSENSKIFENPTGESFRNYYYSLAK